MPPRRHLDDKKYIHGVKMEHLNLSDPTHAAAIPEIKKNIARGMRLLVDNTRDFHADLNKRIPRAEIERHLAFIARLIPTMTPAGSYRRGAKDSADIDIVVREPIADVVARLAQAGYIYHTFGAGDKKFSGIVRLPASRFFRHLDIVFTTPRAYPFAMLYFTGPARFNIVMRIKAKRRSLKLNEYGLWRADGTAVPGITTERDIFAALGIAYKEPADRA